MRRLLMVLALTCAAPVFADCPEPNEELKEQMRWCATHPGCVPMAAVTENCAAVLSRIRNFISGDRKKIDSPAFGEGDLEREARERAENSPATPLPDLPPAQVKANEERDRKRRIEMAAIIALRPGYRACATQPLGAECGADIELYIARRERVAAFRKQYGYWKEVEDIPLTSINEAIEARALRKQQAERALPRAATASPDLTAVVAAIEAYDRYDAQRPQREAAAAVAAERQRAIDAENNRRFQAELAQREQESRQALRDALTTLTRTLETIATDRGGSTDTGEAEEGGGCYDCSDGY